ncbi:MAG: hypothetical protein GF320_04335, partial [Armatimonadia bacterium]|nr:hypothetical protein [Armatimonadia bacterium]
MGPKGMDRREFIKAAGAVAAAAWVWDGDRMVLAQDYAGYPDDAFSRPFHDHIPCFETLGGISPAGSIHTRAALYRTSRHPSGPVERVEVGHRIELTEWDGAPATRWIIQPVHADNAWLRIPLWIRRRPDAISLKAELRGPLQATLSADITELPWPAEPELNAAAWQIGPSHTLRPQMDTELRFALDEVTVRGDEEPDRRTPRWPTNSVVLRLEGL